MTKVVEVAVADVVFNKDIYPRFGHDSATVKKYEASIGEGGTLPPITVNQNMVLLDGWHRWTAHRAQDQELVRAVIIRTEGQEHDKDLACELNAQHGLGLSLAEKKEYSVWKYGTEANIAKRQELEKWLVQKMSVSARTMRRWLSDLKDEEEAKRKRDTAAMYLACYTQQEIADELGRDRSSISKWLDSLVKNGQMTKIHKTSDPNFEKFDRDMQDIWASGCSDRHILQNLLAVYTEPYSIVVDPFAGEGVTIDMCKHHLRRYWVSDKTPDVSRGEDIRTMDIATELPDFDKRWGDVSLVFLRPPEDMAAAEVVDIIKRFSEKMGPQSKIAVVTPPPSIGTDGYGMDKAHDIRTAADSMAGIAFKQKIVAPVSGDKFKAEHNTIAKENGLFLPLTREVIVWEVKYW